VKAWLESRGRDPVDIQAGRTGQFDIVVDDQLVFSKDQTGRFPSEADLANVPM
jgi:selT/selW/selH-like putative selenoprotein